MRRDLQRRIQQLEQALQQLPASQPQLITIYGGLPADGLHATVGDIYLEAKPGEPSRISVCEVLSLSG